MKEIVRGRRKDDCPTHHLYTMPQWQPGGNGVRSLRAVVARRPNGEHAATLSWAELADDPAPTAKVDTVYLAELWVRPLFRRRGIGSYLLAWWMERSKMVPRRISSEPRVGGVHCLKAIGFKGGSPPGQPYDANDVLIVPA